MMDLYSHFGSELGWTKVREACKEAQASNGEIIDDCLLEETLLVNSCTPLYFHFLIRVFIFLDFSTG